jgi:hypothetical protein
MGSNGHGCMSWRADEEITGNKRAHQNLNYKVFCEILFTLFYEERKKS